MSQHLIIFMCIHVWYCIMCGIASKRDRFLLFRCLYTTTAATTTTTTTTTTMFSPSNRWVIIDCVCLLDKSCAFDKIPRRYCLTCCLIQLEQFPLCLAFQPIASERAMGVRSSDGSIDRAQDWKSGMATEIGFPHVWRLEHACDRKEKKRETLMMRLLSCEEEEEELNPN
jgi:hypothetical protein